MNKREQILAATVGAGLLGYAIGDWGWAAGLAGGTLMFLVLLESI